MSDQSKNETEFVKKRAPMLYIIIGTKLVKGALFVAAAICLYALSDNDLPAELRNALHYLRLNPERKFWSDLAVQVGSITEANVRWAAVGTLIYSLFAWVEGVGMIFRVGWAGWLAIGESAFFIPIEVHELVRHPHWYILGVLAFNILIVWYLY